MAAITRFDSVTALRGSTPGVGDLAELTGYYNPGDGGGGEFYWDNVSTATDNGGTIIKATPANGRWFRVFQQPVNVQWFGAKGDGSTDDTTDINNAISAITAGEVIFQPNLTYVISGTLTVSNPLTIDLCGATLQFPASVAATSVSAFTVSSNNVTIGNGIINGTYNPATDVPTPGVGPSGVKNSGGFSNLRIERLTIQYVQAYGINTGNASNLRIINCNLINTGYISIFCNNTTAGLAAGLITGNVIDRSGLLPAKITQPNVAIRGSSTTNYTTGLVFTNNKLLCPVSPTDASAACMELRYSNTCTLDNNVFTNGTIGLSIVFSYYVTASANTCFGCGFGFEIAEGAFNTLDSNVINGNGVANTTGILLDGTGVFATFNTLSNNNISNITLLGIEVFKGSSNNNIIGGQITAATSGQTCIYLAGAQSCLISGVYMDGSGTGARGVMMDNTSWSTNTAFICSGTIVDNCTFYSFASSAFAIYSPNGGAITGLRLSNNFYNGTTMLSTTLAAGATVPTPYYYGNSPELIGSKVILATGTNASAGTATLAAGTVTVSNTLVTSGSLVLLSVSAVGGAQGMLSYTKVAGTSFTITSTSATDTSTVAWMIVN